MRINKILWEIKIKKSEKCFFFRAGPFMLVIVILLIERCSQIKINIKLNLI
jgi:hypothetical protein